MTPAELPGLPSRASWALSSCPGHFPHGIPHSVLRTGLFRRRPWANARPASPALIDQQDQLQDYLKKVPTALNMIGRAIGSYGDFVNFYACDITLKINGLQAGGPVRTVRLFQQPTGRCTPQ